jgi:anti-sigma B factor antagonist
MENLIQRMLAEDGTATVTVRGEVDFSNAEELADCLGKAVAEWSPSSLRIDLGSASLIDSSGLGALIEGYRAATEAGAHFLVVNPTSSFRRVLDVTGLCEFFGLTSEDTAVQTQATGA